MSGRCKDCKWWGQDYDLNGEPLPDCRGSSIVRDNARMCCARKMSIFCDDFPGHYQGKILADFESLEPLHPDATAVIGENGGADGLPLWTGPEFGCVHFEQREGSDG